MAGFQGSVNEFMNGLDEDQLMELEQKRAEWMKKSYPIDLQRKTAERLAHSSIQESAVSQYKEMGMRSVVWEFHENKAGTKLFQLRVPFCVNIYLSIYLTFYRHDFNEDLGNVKVQPFVEKFPDAVADFRIAWIEYMKYCYQVESGEIVESVTENRPTISLIDLDRDPKGYPLVPQEEGNLINMKRIIRSFVTAHYRNDNQFQLFR